jgi:hypothetical protein
MGSRQADRSLTPDEVSLYRKEIDVHLVTGACECVSLVGPGLGGGHGYLQGFYGLIADNFLSARVVLADGSLITASASQNSGAFNLRLQSGILRDAKPTWLEEPTDFMTQISSGLSKELVTILESSLLLQVASTMSHRTGGRTYSTSTHMTRLRLCLVS